MFRCTCFKCNLSPKYRLMKKSIWRIKDLIDLEYFLQRDEGKEDESAQKSVLRRDRYIYLNKIMPLEKEDASTPRSAIRAWLEQRKKMEKSDTETMGVLPGEAFDEGYRLLRYGFLIVGLLSGSSLAFSFLNYRGTEPLNISSYLALFVLTQCLALLLLMGISVARRVRRAPFRSSIIYTLISGLMVSLIMKIKHRALKTLTGSKRGSLEAVMGLVRGKRQIYGSLFYWPVFILAQIFGVGFNLGVLGATLMKVLGSDVAFGWQSTVQFSAQAVFKLVQAIALPWSWLVPADFAHPTFYQVEGSHMVLKDGIYHLATKDLVSWWPFLCFVVLTYSLLPRLILLVMGIMVQKRALLRIDFGHRACERLLNRMLTPLVSTGGRSVSPEDLRNGDTKAPEAKASDPRDVLTGKSMIALIPDDIFEACTDDELESVIFKTFGYPIQRRLRFGVDEEGDKRVLDELSTIKREDAATNFLILQEGWQPPIRENLLFIQELRMASGETSMIWVGLIGRPKQGAIFTRVKEEEWDVWYQKLKAVGDPYLGLERLVANGE
jgi:hypothetical protein